MDKQSVILRVYGRVQGVGFRFYTQRKAQELGILGYVQNKPDGSVYIEAEGEAKPLQQFMHWCEAGPAWAHVTEVKKQFVPVRDFEGFKIR
jgi:acylphosphatase